MSQANQKNIWRQEKEQMLRDKQNQPKEIIRRKIPLRMADPKSKKSKLPANNINPTALSTDDILRRQLGI